MDYLHKNNGGKMKILTIIYLIYVFFKTWYYGIYELKTNKNKTASTAIFILAIVRSNISNIYYYNELLGFEKIFFLIIGIIIQAHIVIPLTIIYILPVLAILFATSLIIPFTNFIVFTFVEI